MTLSRTFYLIKTDYRALVQSFDIKNGTFLKIASHPGFQAIFLYRCYHYLHLNGFRPLARFFHMLNVWITGADIGPRCEIGESFLMFHSVGMVVYAKIGDRVTMTNQNGLGGNGSHLNIGAGPGLGVVEDDVVMGANSLLLGPFKIGHNSFICPRVFVNANVPEGSVVTIPKEMRKMNIIKNVKIKKFKRL